MDEELYLLWHTRNGGWLTASATYSSNRSDAKQFPESEAMRYAKAQYRNGMSEFGVIPISLSLLEEIMRPV